MDAFISVEESLEIKDLLFDTFLTSKLMGTTIDITLSRDTEGVLTNIVVEDVLLSLQARESQEVTSGAISVTTTQAKLSREIPFDIAVNDRFVIQGKAGRVVVVYPTMNRVIRADIVFDNPRG